MTETVDPCQYREVATFDIELFLDLLFGPNADPHKLCTGGNRVTLDDSDE